MGLFDRFRKKVKQADDDTSFMTDEGSELAEKAIAEREAALRSMNQKEKAPEEKSETASEWDDFDDEIADPFAVPTNSKERKRLARDQATKPSLQPATKQSKRDPMDSTTGRRLAESDMAFEIDLSEYHTNIGGMVISGGRVLDEILNELEDELLSSDMGHDAASELITNLRAHLIAVSYTHLTLPTKA